MVWQDLVGWCSANLIQQIHKHLFDQSVRVSFPDLIFIPCYGHIKHKGQSAYMTIQFGRFAWIAMN